MKQELARRQTFSTTEKSRGRVETRTVTTTTNLVDSGYLDWPGVQQLIRLERHTTVAGKTRTSTTYAITSLSRTQAHAKQLLRLLRGRWEIENRCFHVADTTFKQDHHRTRTGHAAQTLANLNYFATNLARQLKQSPIHTIREHALKPDLLLQRLHILKN
mgnify:FL=1